MERLGISADALATGVICLNTEVVKIILPRIFQVMYHVAKFLTPRRDLRRAAEYFHELQNVWKCVKQCL